MKKEHLDALLHALNRDPLDVLLADIKAIYELSPAQLSRSGLTIDLTRQALVKARGLPEGSLSQAPVAHSSPSEAFRGPSETDKAPEAAPALLQAAHASPASSSFHRPSSAHPGSDQSVMALTDQELALLISQLEIADEQAEAATVAADMANQISSEAEKALIRALPLWTAVPLRIGGVRSIAFVDVARVDDLYQGANAQPTVLRVLPMLEGVA